MTEVNTIGGFAKEFLVATSYERLASLLSFIRSLREEGNSVDAAAQADSAVPSAAP